MDASNSNKNLHLLRGFRKREIQASGYTTSFKRHFQVSRSSILRLGLEHELEGHAGCINCIEWNKQGRLLASGSDDLHVIIWDPFRHRKLTSVRTVHTGNIFSVKFMPYSDSRHVATGAGDCKVTLVDLETKETLNILTLTKGRVKRLAVVDTEPHMLFSASEDGLVMQYDLRTPEAYSKENPRCILVNLNSFIGQSAEAKCLAINPTKPELLAVGCSDPYVRLYDRRMISCKDMTACCDDYSYYHIPAGCVKYYVAGHIPAKMREFQRRMRMLAVTYLTFSPDGNDLLVNLGGEQIYLFDINNSKHPFHIYKCDWASPSGSNGVTNGINGCSYNVEHGEVLPHDVETLKQRANHEFERQNFIDAIILYNRAIEKYPKGAVLYCNRAAALMNRNWDGDYYAALRDCTTAINLNKYLYKAYYRMCRCLLSLNRLDEASEVFSQFNRAFPDQAKGHSYDKLEFELDEAQANPRGVQSQNSVSTEEGIQVEENSWRENACDYSQRYCGHCNTTTDIKEASFFGNNGQYICAGSDDGSFFIWDRHTSNIVRSLKGDDCIVNCLQPHSEMCYLATSGVDSVVRLWSPLPEDAVNERDVSDSNEAAAANQKRMNTDPLELMLYNMGYTFQRGNDGEEDDGRGRNDNDMRCRPF